ncbi:MAG: tRNA lysidine(34) synthetase TilS [Bacteroidia bacterium]|nr:tRNA lysidine(34) synthetase TilS [Bacteroidia bacterium]
MLLTNFNNFILTKDLLKKDQSVLVAVSGGLDSIVLCRLFKESKIDFAIAHCNFKLRGKESDGDQEFVKKLAAYYKVPFFSIQFKTKAFAKEKKLSTQEAARELRYQWFEKIRAEHQYDKIAVAHHLNDSIETFFINTIRGTGLAGMKGISAINGHIIRPLLFAGREELETFAKKKRLKWREDSSNKTDDYLRNKIRHAVIPVLKEKNPDFEKSMERSLEFFNFANQIQKTFIEDWKKKNTTIAADGSITIKLKAVWDFQFSNSLLSAVLHSYGITNLEPEKILNSSPGKIFQAKNYRLLFDRTTLVLQSKKIDDNHQFLISHTPDKVELGDHKFSFETVNSARLTSIPRESHIQVIDAGKLHFPLTVRRWKSGDTFYPLGMTKKKKISDFLIDKKVNRFDKEMTYVLLSDKDIVCILGHRIDDRFKITDETVSVLYIEQIYG